MKERNKRMASRITTQKTLFLNEKDYKTFLDFIFLMNELANNLDDADIDELQEAIEQACGAKRNQLQDKIRLAICISQSK